MLPNTVAIVDDDVDFTDSMCQALAAHGIDVQGFRDSNELLVDPRVFAYDFYVVDLLLPGVDGVELIRILRRRTTALVLVLSGRVETDGFSAAVEAGADMFLEKPVAPEQLVLVVRALQRRARMRAEGLVTWMLDERAAQLVAPDGTRVPLGENDLALMRCFLEANGGVVTRDKLVGCLGRNAARMADNTLHATIYRLRKRIEGSTGSLLPLQSEQRVGYVFRAPLKLV